MRYKQRFRRSVKAPVEQKTTLVNPGVSKTTGLRRSPGKCRACGKKFTIGESIVLVQLRKVYRTPCATCGKKPIGKKKYHAACVPTDLNKAMDFDPAKVPPPFDPYAQPIPPPVAKVAPPPKPPTFNDLALGALLALEKAMAFKVVPPAKKAECEAAIAKYKLIKARALRPGTPQEGEVATFLAIQQLVKTVFTA